MFDTMTATKVVGAGCGALLVFLLGGWAAETVYHGGGGGHGEGEAQQAFVIDTGAAEEAAPAETVDFGALLAAANPADGEKVFAKCRACHKLDGSDGTGPHLNGIVNKAKAASPGFAYSAVLAGMSGDTWTPENLQAFLQNPRGYAAGTKMAFAGLPKVEDRASVIAYLATTN